MTSTALFAMTAGAFAADLPARAPAPAPVMVYAAPQFSWTGFYIGLNAGGIASQSKARFTGATDGILTAESFLGELFPRRFDLTETGFIGGAQIGYNWQMGSLVLGVEADFQGTTLDKTHSETKTFGFFPFFGGQVISSAGTEMPWFATLRGRIGYAAFDRTMIYVTGGLAVADVKHRRHADVLFGFGDSTVETEFTGSRGRTKAGWTAGAGVEHALNAKWTFKAEYLYYNLGDTTVINTARGDGFLEGEATSFRFDNNGHIFRVGVNYKFGSHQQAVVARY